MDGATDIAGKGAAIWAVFPPHVKTIIFIPKISLIHSITKLLVLQRNI